MLGGTLLCGTLPVAEQEWLVDECVDEWCFVCLSHWRCWPVLAGGNCTPLREGWQLGQSACNCSYGRLDCPRDRFKPMAGWKDAVPSTVLASQAAPVWFPRSLITA